MTEVQYEEHNTREKDFMILIFTINSCGLNNKVVFFNIESTYKKCLREE